MVRVLRIPDGYTQESHDDEGLVALIMCLAPVTFAEIQQTLGIKAD